MSSTTLITLDSAEQHEGHEGELFLHGSGFPTGSPCTLEWDGTIYRPGGSAQRWKGTTRCRATSDFQVIAAADVPLGLLPVGTFEGALGLRFAGAEGSLVAGSLERARVRLVDRPAFGPKEQLSLSARARAFQRTFGILDVEIASGGLVLTRLTPEGAAARSGCLEGDLVSRIGDAPVERPYDLLGSPNQSELRLSILRKGELTPRELSVRRTSPVRSALDGLRVLLFGLSLLGASLLPDGARWLNRGASQAHAPKAWAGWCAALVVSSIALTGALDVRVLWLLPVALQLAWWCTLLARRTLSTQVALDGCVELGIASLGLAALGATQGSLTIQLGSAQAAALPWQWPLLSAPATWLVVSVLAGSMRAPATLPTQRAELARTVRPSSAFESALGEHVRSATFAGKVGMLAAFGTSAGSLPEALVTGAPGLQNSLCWIVFALQLALAAWLLRRPLWEASSRLTRGAQALLAPALAFALSWALAAVSELVGLTCLGLGLGMALRWCWLRWWPGALGQSEQQLSPFL